MALPYASAFRLLQLDVLPGIEHNPEHIASLGDFESHGVRDAGRDNKRISRRPLHSLIVLHRSVHAGSPDLPDGIALGIIPRRVFHLTADQCGPGAADDVIEFRNFAVIEARYGQCIFHRFIVKDERPEVGIIANWNYTYGPVAASRSHQRINVALRDESECSGHAGRTWLCRSGLTLSLLLGPGSCQGLLARGHQV